MFCFVFWEKIHFGRSRQDNVFVQTPEPSYWQSYMDRGYLIFFFYYQGLGKGLR